VKGSPQKTSVKPGNSSVQRKAERWVIDAFNKGRKAPAKIRPPAAPLSLHDGAQITVDAISADEKTVVEIYVRQGDLKPGHRRKIAMDALKLVALKGKFEHRILLFAHEPIKRELEKTNTWLAQAIKQAGIEVEVVQLGPAQKKQITQAQERQRR